MPRARSLLVLAATAGAAVALPATAAATPTVHADRPCYTQGQPISLTGAGFTPGGPIPFLGAFAGRTANASAVPLGAPITADPAGALSTRIPAPALNSDRDVTETLTITANDQTKQAAQPPLPPTEVAATTQVTLSLWAVGILSWVNGRGDPRASSDFIAVGWEPFRRIYAHYFLNRTRVRSVRIGAVRGPCGDIAKRIRQFPFRPVRAGQWTVYFSPTQVFDREGAWIRVRVRVPRSKAVPARR
jgi:hypothetical protein